MHIPLSHLSTISPPDKNLVHVGLVTGLSEYCSHHFNIKIYTEGIIKQKNSLGKEQIIQAWPTIKRPKLKTPKYLSYLYHLRVCVFARLVAQNITP